MSHFESKFMNLNERSMNINTPEHHQLRAYSSSAARMMKLAKEQLLQFNSRNDDVILSVFGYVEARRALGHEVSLDMLLAMLLHAAAEKVDNQQYVCARKLLSMCYQFASKDGNSPTQRLAHYFVEALQEKTDRECGIVLPASGEMDPDPEGPKRNRPTPMDEKLGLLSLQPEILAAQQENPFSLVAQFMTVGTIRDRVASAKKVHLVDFSLDNGSQWTLIMQDFAAIRSGGGFPPLELLRITAVGTCKRMMEETGKRLSSFAAALNLNFAFHTVVSDLKDLREDSFELEDDETVAVYVASRLWTLLAWPNYLEALIGTIKSLKPSVMVVKEMEAGTNRNGFMERFEEALTFLSGLFDFTKDCMEDHALYRKLSEEFCCRSIIRNVVNAEGARRVHRHERIGFWRSLFGKFDILETELSRSSLGGARLLVQTTPRFGSFTFDEDGKCLVLGWKGSPFLSVSAWKFPRTTYSYS